MKTSELFKDLETKMEAANHLKQVNKDINLKSENLESTTTERIFKADILSNSKEIVNSVLPPMPIPTRQSSSLPPKRSKRRDQKKKANRHWKN